MAHYHFRPEPYEQMITGEVMSEADPDRASRFRREAHVPTCFYHPDIAAVCSVADRSVVALVSCAGDSPLAASGEPGGSSTPNTFTIMDSTVTPNTVVIEVGERVICLQYRCGRP